MSSEQERPSARQVIHRAYVEWANTDGRTTQPGGTVTFGDFSAEALADEGYAIVNVDD